MPDSFFANPKTRKRKRTQTLRHATKRPKIDEELSDQHSSGDEWGGMQEPQDMDLRVSGDEDEDETPAEKRLRLAQVYLNTVKESLADGEFDAADIDKELISSRLKQDILSHSGKVYLFIADSFSPLLSDLATLPILRTRGHRFSVTSAVTSPSSEFLYTSGKEGSIIKWHLATGKRLTTLHKVRKSRSNDKPSLSTTSVVPPVEIGHTDEVLVLSLSSDGKYLVSGGRDRRLIVWNADTLTHIKSFQGPMNHKDVISALSFRHSTHQLFTASFDRTIKLYDLSPSIMGYTETLFGHQDPILSLSSLSSENCVSVGGRDKTARYWKIAQESQLVFRGGGSGIQGGKRSKMREILEGGLGVDDEDDEDADNQSKKEQVEYLEGSLECVAMIDESTFVTGGDSGSISLWSTQKKKPIFTYPLAHGLHQVQSSTEGLLKTPRWITALAALAYSDLFISGSWDGQIRLWKLDSKLKSFSVLGNIPIPGVINSLQLVSPPSLPSSPLLPKNKDAIPSSSPSSSSSPRPPQTQSTSAEPSNSSEQIPSWLHTHPHFRTHADRHIHTHTPIHTSSPAVLVIVGAGQEHRFGRWLTMKEGGAVNGAYVIALVPSCLSFDNSAATAAINSGGGGGEKTLRTL
ncbi:pre-rRNA processing protein [Leucoagaricus gongylophorus]